MSYLEDFKTQISNRDSHKFFQLWEEYSTSEEVDVKELEALLTVIQKSDFSSLFGKLVETAIPLWQTIKEPESSHKILALLIDIQNTNSPLLADLAYEALESRYGQEPEFKERLRQTGLRTREAFQGAISKYELLRHMKKGNYVFHSGGWGTGEVMDVSPIREQVSVEFENVAGVKHLSFENAFKTLKPLSAEHFLTRRFSDPDKFEKDVKNDPVWAIKLLLQDLGPKTAAEIKDEMCDLVIPEKDWNKWWQSTRGKIKKDTMIYTPSSLKESFSLRDSEICHTEELLKKLEAAFSLEGTLQIAYNYARELPQAFKKERVKQLLKDQLIRYLEDSHLSKAQELQIILFLHEILEHELPNRQVKSLIQSIDGIEEIIDSIPIPGLKRQTLVMVRRFRTDWIQIFTRCLFSAQQNALRDYLLRELSQENALAAFLQELEKLLHHPEKNPEAFLWYFQKLAKKNPDEIHYADKEGRCRFLEGLLVLLHKIEHDEAYRDFAKKIYTLLTSKRFEIVRLLIEGTSPEFIKEFILLVSKCHTFSDQEQKILRSLAYVVQPSLAPEKKQRGEQDDLHVIWTSEEGYIKTQERLKHIATIEMIENAKEVEAARALGDLRENSEYKFACERRSRLQGEMKTLSKQLNNARVITPLDMIPGEVGPGSIVQIENGQGERVTYKILGPWDADVDKNIISYQSQFALAMMGHKEGDVIDFRGEQFKVLGIKSYLE